MMAKNKNTVLPAKSVEELFERGYHIVLSSCMKRMEIDNGKGRNWYYRFTWKIIRSEKEDFESDWEGFSTAKEAIDDLLNKVR